MRTLVLYISLLFTGFSAAAQPLQGEQNPRKAEKVQALYVAYITQQLQLTPDEAQCFWPLHTQLQSEMQSVNSSNLTDLDKQQRVLDVKKRYQPQIARIIGSQRAGRFYEVHDQFANKLLEVRQRRQENKANGLPRERLKGKY